MRNCEDEDYAHGTERQKQLDAECLDPPVYPVDYEPPMVIRKSRMPHFAVGVGPQKYQRHPPAEFDKLPWADEVDPFEMSVAEKIGWCILFCLMAFGLLWGV